MKTRFYHCPICDAMHSEGGQCSGDDAFDRVELDKIMDDLDSEWSEVSFNDE